MQVNVGGREPNDPPSAGMRQLKFIACGYASATAGVAGLGTKPEILAVLAATGLAHAALASWHGIRRGEQDVRIREAEAAAGGYVSKSPQLPPVQADNARDERPSELVTPDEANTEETGGR